MPLDRLDLVGKLYQPSMLPRATEVAHGCSSAGPLVVDLDPTTFCDLACPECISGKLLNQGRFSPQRLQSLAGEIIELGARAVILIGGGEPLAHRGTRDVLNTLGEAGVAIGVVTNGTLIKQNLDELSRYASWVRVSVDAATPETFGLFRPDRKGNSVFDKVIQNMRALAETKQGALGYSFLLMVRDEESGRVSNHHEVLQAAELAKDIGCDYFEIKTMFDDDHHIVGVPDEVLRSVEDQISRARGIEDDHFQIIDSSTMHSLRERKGPVQPKDYHRCQIAELRTLVTPSGVYICPYHRGNAQGRLGDAVTDSLQQIWETADRGRIDPSRDCRFHCARHDSNLELDAIRDGRGRPALDTEEDPFI